MSTCNVEAELEVVKELCAETCENTDQEYEEHTGQPRKLNYSCAEAVRNLDLKEKAPGLALYQMPKRIKELEAELEKTKASLVSLANESASLVNEALLTLRDLKVARAQRDQFEADLVETRQRLFDWEAGANG